MPQKLADDLRRARIELGLTQEQVAERSGLSLTSIKSYEAGRPASTANLELLRKTILTEVPVPTISVRRISDEWELVSDLRAGGLRIIVQRPRSRDPG